jgi:hypothetical protein
MIQLKTTPIDNMERSGMMEILKEVKEVCLLAYNEYQDYLKFPGHNVDEYTDGRIVGRGLMAEMILNIIGEREEQHKKQKVLT